MNEQDKIDWQSYEYEYREKTADWFWAVAIITICIATVAIIYDNPLFAVFMIIAGFTMLMTSHKKPRVIDFEINTKGILIDKVLYPYGNLKSFWVEESKFAPPKLFIKSEKFITPVIVLPIETDIANTSTVRAFLLSFLPEEKIHEPFSHRFMEFLGF